MNEEILNNIWNILSSDSSLNIKAANFDEWKNTFTQDKNIQTNVYNYLKQNHTLQAANQEEWTTSVMGKTNGSANATPGVEPIVTESGLDVGTLGLPETSEGLNTTLLAISNGVTKNHIKVKSRLAEEYFSLDNFKQSRMKVGSGLSFQGYARSEEDDLKSWFGEEKYEQYLQYKQSEVFDSKWVDDEIVKQIVGVVKQEEVEQYIGRLDIGDIKPDFKGHKDMVADARKAVQEGIFNIFDPEDASVTGDGQNWLQQYIDALAIDKAKETKQKELGKTSVFFGDRATDEDIMKLRVQDSAAEKVLANYFNHKFTGYKKKSKDWNSKYNDYIEVNKTYEPQFIRISTSLNALGKVDEYSSKEKIEQYNNLVAEGNNLSAEYKKALSDQNLNFEDITSEAASLQSGFDKIVDNFDKVSEVTTIAKALALDYGWLNATSLSFESGMAEMGAWISSALKGFAYAADKVEGVGSAFADPTKLKQIMVNPQDFLSEDQNTAHMDRWRGLNASVISYNESVQNYKQASLPLDIDWDDVGWDNIGQWSSQALSNNAFSISTALAYGGAIRAGMNVPKATKILSGTFFGLEGGAKYTHMEIDQKNAGKYIAGLQESLKSATTKGERVQILDQIDYYEKALNATEMEKAFSSIAYGGIAMYAERLGTMRTLRNLNRISPTNNRLTIANTMKSTWQVGKGVGIEYVEEFATQVGHNLVDMTVLDQNKSLLDGIDNNFNANIIFSTLAIQGPSVSMNVFNSIRGEVITQGEILENRKRTNQIIEINGALQADQESGFKLLDAGTREFMESENRRLIREAGMKDAEMFANVANMTAAEVKQMFAVNQKKRDKLKQIQNLGASSAYEKAGSNYIEKQKEKLVNDIKNLNGQRDQLRGKPGARRKQIIEATLKNDKIQVETEFYLGKAYAAKNIVKGLGNVKEFGKINEDGTIDLTDLETYLDKKVKKGNITEKQKKGYLKGFRQGHNASFVGNDVILVESNIIRNINGAETALEKSIHAYSVIHELQHINDVNVGLVQDLDVVESSKVAVKGIQNEVETLYKQGKIKEKDYVTFLKRVGGYTRDNIVEGKETVDLMELLTIAGELKNAGVLSENSTDPLLSLKLMINQFSNKYFKKGEMFFKLNNTQDVLGYIDSFQRSTRNQTLVLGPEEEVKKPKFSQTTAEKAAKEKAVNDLGKMGWTDKTWKESGAKFAIETIKDEKLIDGLVYAQYKVEDVPVNFVNDVITELSADIKKFNSSYTKKNGEKVKAKWGTEQENDSLFGYLQGLIKFRAGDVYKKLYKSDDAIKGAKNIGETTKEGEVKVQVAAETDTAMEALETEDLSPAAQAKKKADKAKGKEKVESEFRRKIGIETGSELYNKVLESARKALLKAYEVGTAARNIQRKLRDEANVYLFKSVKNFLGTKDYIKNLKKFREPIVKALFTADLVQLERNVPDNERILTTFVKKLTSKQEVQDAVNQNLLPKSALNIIDKGTAVSLYKKKIPTEEQFLKFFYPPLVNPVTGSRSGLRGTRKDALAKGMAGALAYDATLEVAQEQEIIDKRATLAEINGTEILKDDIQRLGDVINRSPDVKFSEKTNKTTYKQKAIKIVGNKVVVDFTQAEVVLDDIFYDNSKVNFYQNISEKEAEKYGGKFIVNAIIDAYHDRGIERLDSKVLIKFIKENKRPRDKISTVYEQFFISSAALALEKISGKKAKVNLVVREGGRPDVHFELDGQSIGLEIKMDSARGVSRTWRFDETSTNENPIDVDATNRLIDKIKNTAKDSRFKGIDFAKGVTVAQAKDLRIYKHRFNHSEKVTAAYLAHHYTSKAIPEYFINIGDAGVYYMLSSDKSSAINSEILRIANELNIPQLNGTFDLISRMSIGSIRTNGTRATTIRIEPMIDSKSEENFPIRSTVNLSNKKDMNSFVKEVNKSLVPFSKVINGKKLNKAIAFSRSTNNPAKGITVLDFDDTLATSKSLIRFTRPDGTTGTLNAEQYASTYEELSDLGYKFDFSEFSKVVKGKTAPLFNKAMKLQGKFGSENMFVLTARPADSAPAIFEFLKANGLNIPLKNITGLANSTSEAKALWMAEKVGEGYNDFYFADDALQNVQAVDNMLKQFDVKRKIQQAKVKFSKSEYNTNKDPYSFVNFKTVPKEIVNSKSYKKWIKSLEGMKLFHGTTTDPNKISELGTNHSLNWFIVGGNDNQRALNLTKDIEREFDGEAENSVLSIDASELAGRILPDADFIGPSDNMSISKDKTFQNKIKALEDKYKTTARVQPMIRKPEMYAEFLDIITEHNPMSGYSQVLFDKNGKLNVNSAVVIVGGLKPNQLKVESISDPTTAIAPKFSKSSLRGNKAVKNMLDQFDVKSKVQQARVKFSKNMDTEFNDILENITGIESKKRFSIIKGRKRGESKGKFRFFIPPSHEDFVGLLYNFMGKGKEGNAHRDFFEQALVRPLNRGYREIDTAKQAIANDYKSLNKQFTEVKDKLVKNTPDGDFTFQDAIRVYLWDKHGHKIPGLTETDQKKLAELVMSDSQLQAYAETLNIISKQENYVAPGQAWETANIRIDLVDATGRVGRADYFTEFNENAEVIFSEENLNKIEAAYGRSAREAIEDMLHRIKTGVNRPKGTNGKPNMFMNWLNASVSGVMFFNTRSALLQQLSNVNFLNFADNNIFKAGLAFANQPQYWKDFAMIFNSDMLKQRRGGLGTDINGAELAESIKKARPDNMFDQVSIVVGKALKLGFLPTQIGDNIAIATGGAAFYRNRVNKYVKDGLSVKEAETKAFTDLQNITQSTQQSARPDMVSQQQASWIGKLVLNFLNTPSQYNRIIKKAALDIKNRRITGPNTTQLQSDMSNMSRILYYGAAQNLIFYGLQTALFAVMFDDDGEESEAFLKKKERVINGSIDTILRGSGIYGVGISTLKNMMIKFLEQREKGYNKDESAVIMEMLNFSPVVGIKARKIVNAEKTLNYNKKVIDEMETFDIDNPQWSAVTNYVESITTAPVNRLYQKTINLRNAADNQYTALQRALFFSGYTTWSLDLGDTKKMKEIKETVKIKSKEESKQKSKEKRKNKKPLTREQIRIKNRSKSRR